MCSLNLHGLPQIKQWEFVPTETQGKEEKVILIVKRMNMHRCIKEEIKEFKHYKEHLGNHSFNYINANPFSVW